MPAVLAAAEARVSAAVVAHLANTTAAHTPGGGGGATAADVIFLRPGDGVAGFDVVDDAPEIVCGTATWPAAAEGDAIEIASGLIGEGDYVVRAVLSDKIDGLKRLTLAEA